VEEGFIATWDRTVVKKIIKNKSCDVLTEEKNRGEKKPPVKKPGGGRGEDFRENTGLEGPRKKRKSRKSSLIFQRGHLRKNKKKKKKKKQQKKKERTDAGLPPLRMQKRHGVHTLLLLL